MQTQITDLQFSRYADTGKVAYWYTQHYFGYLGRGATPTGVSTHVISKLYRMASRADVESYREHYEG